MWCAVLLLLLQQPPALLQSNCAIMAVCVLAGMLDLLTDMNDEVHTWSRQ
jgi:hypothetical protein